MGSKESDVNGENEENEKADEDEMVNNAKEVTKGAEERPRETRTQNTMKWAWFCDDVVKEVKRRREKRGAVEALRFLANDSFLSLFPLLFFLARDRGSDLFSEPREFAVEAWSDGGRQFSPLFFLNLGLFTPRRRQRRRRRRLKDTLTENF